VTIHVSPEACPALVLNADFRPLSYYPLSLWSWQDAIKAVCLDRVNIVSNYDTVIHSPSFEMQLPSVVSLKDYVKPARHPAFTRFNVFLRDRFQCQYCGAKDDLTFDHVIPRSKGGLTTWENVVAACAPCNQEGQPDAERDQDVPASGAVPSHRARSSQQWPGLPAQPFAPELARLPLLGYRARAVRLI
jgi:5-methylcytosine-specific restriction endonuclease McrA